MRTFTATKNMSGSSQRKKIKPDDIRQRGNIVYHESAGGIIFCLWRKKLYTTLLKRKGKGWAIPKGHRKKRESFIKCVLREIKEEIGVKDSLTLIGKIGIDEYESYFPRDSRKHFKKVHLFLFTVPEKAPLDPPRHERFTVAKWLGLSQAKMELNASPFTIRRAMIIKGRKIENSIDETILTTAEKMFKKYLALQKTHQKV